MNLELTIKFETAEEMEEISKVLSRYQQLKSITLNDLSVLIKELKEDGHRDTVEQTVLNYGFGLTDVSKNNYGRLYDDLERLKDS